ncbi:MAG: RluA family pseudouridine synthase [Cyanobacteria bacterium J06621_11]
MARDEIAVFAELDRLKRMLIELENLPARDELARVSQQYSDQLAVLASEHRRRKEKRRGKRSCLKDSRDIKALAALDRESQGDGIARRQLKQARSAALQALTAEVVEANGQIQALKGRYRALTGWWQEKVQAAYLAALERGDYSAKVPLSIVYQDEFLVVVDKPAGLLSVPGRGFELQDSVVGRLRYRLRDCSFVEAVHRLDQATSGLMVIAVCKKAHVVLSRQFAKRQVDKRYEAILSRPLVRAAGRIDLPLGRERDGTLRRVVDEREGKPSVTEFRVLKDGRFPRMEFVLFTGRSHQIRVHAAHERGLNAPILGDTLYGVNDSADRLCLHATRLDFVHPETSERVSFCSEASF